MSEDYEHRSESTFSKIAIPVAVAVLIDVDRWRDLALVGELRIPDRVGIAHERTAVRNRATVSAAVRNGATVGNGPAVRI